MTQNLRKNFKLLELLMTTKNESTRKTMLKDLSKNDKFFRALKEVCRNVLIGNIPMSKYKKKKLQPHEKLIKGIVLTKKLTTKKRKQMVTQSGGFLPFLLPTVISILSTLFNGKL